MRPLVHSIPLLPCRCSRLRHSSTPRPPRSSARGDARLGHRPPASGPTQAQSAAAGGKIRCHDRFLPASQLIPRGLDLVDRTAAEGMDSRFRASSRSM